MRGTYVFLFAVLAMLAGAAPAFAADGSLLDIRYDTAIFSIIVFVGLLVILRLYAWGPILQGLQKREETIRSSLEEAKKTRSDMEAMRAQFQKELADAHQEIPKLIDEARKDAENLKIEMRASASAEIQAERERLRREIEMAKDQAIKQLWEQTAQLAALISTKAIGRALTEDDHRRLIDESLHELTTLNN